MPMGSKGIRKESLPHMELHDEDPTMPEESYGIPRNYPTESSGVLNSYGTRGVLEIPKGSYGILMVPMEFFRSPGESSGIRWDP